MTVFRLKNLLKILLFVYSIAVFCFIALIKKPERYGDGFEYIYMTEAFLQHQTPNQMPDDVAIAQQTLKKQNPHIFIPPAELNFYEAHDHQYYSWHFWLYSLAVAPVQKILRLFNLNELKAYGLTNTFFYLLMLWIIYFNSPQKKKFLLIVLMAFSPLMPYITWTHAEVFSASLVTIALVFYFKENLPLSILCSALAACQNPPIGFLTVWFGMRYLYQTAKQYQTTQQFDLREFIITGLCGLPLIMSPLFYYVKFSVFSLIEREGFADFHLISLAKLFSYFFDLNQGAIVYSGLLLFIFIFCFIQNMYRRNFKNAALVVCVFLMAGLSLTAPNWNCGLSSVIRYFVWTYPLLVFYIVYNISCEAKNIFTWLLIANALGLSYLQRGLNGNVDYVHHTPIAQYILTHFPELYNPEKEIFIERTIHNERDHYYEDIYPVAFIDNQNHIRKIITDKNGWKKLPHSRIYEIADEKFYQKNLQKFTKSIDPIRYINVKKDEIVKIPTNLLITDKINFNAIDDDISGLSSRESWGRWSVGHKTEFRLTFKNADLTQHDIVVKFMVSPFLTSNHRQQKVVIRGNGNYLTTWNFAYEKQNNEQFLTIPRHILSPKNAVDLIFETDQPISPKEIGYNNDVRQLGIGFISAEILHNKENEQ